MKTRVPLYAVCTLLFLAVLPACSSTKKKTTAPDDAALTPTEQPAGETLDKDVLGEDYATPGEPLPSDADIPAASSSLPGSPAASYPAQPTGSSGYPDYDAGSVRSHGGTASAGTYTVKSGDSLWTISRKNGTTVHALAAANGLTEKSVLRPGQKLILAGGSSSKSSSPSTVSSSSTASADGTYRVKRGDSYSTIARSHGTTVKKLKEANGATSDSLREGQILKLR